MKLPAILGIFTTKIEEFPRALNELIHYFRTVFDHGVSFSDNITACFSTQRVYVSSGTVSPLPVRIPWPYPRVTPRGCLVVSTTCSDKVDRVTTALGVGWTYVSGQVVVDDIRGVFTDNFYYDITFLVFA